MLIRISLIVAILAGLGVAGIAFFPLQDQIKTTIAARDDFNTKWHAETKAKQTALKNLADTTKTLETRTKELADTKQQLSDAKVAETAAEKRADDFQASLKKTQQELQTTSDKLAQWEALGIPIAQARDILNSLKRVTEEKDALEAEKAIIYAKARKLQAKIDQMVDPTRDVEEPEGLAGKVMVVDPRYDFVILNIGEKQGVVPFGKLLVHRNGKLVAKLVISESIEPNQCVANVIPRDIMEGDEVFY